MSTLYMVFIPGSPEPPKGPWSRAQVVEHHVSGSLPDDAKVCLVGEDKWIPIGDLVPKPPEPESYEVTTDGETIVGPVSIDQIRRGLVAGKLPDDAQGRRTGTDAWIPIGVLVAPPPPPPSDLLSNSEVLSARHPRAGNSKPAPVVSAAIVVGGVLLAGSVTWAVTAGRGASNHGSTPTHSGSLSNQVTAPSVTRRDEGASDDKETRAHLLASDSADDWRSLVQSYPESEEAKKAAEKLERNESLCADLDIWADLVERETASLALVIPRFRIKNQGATDGASLFRNALDMQKDCRHHVDALETSSQQIASHRLKPGEEAQRDRLASGVTEMRGLWLSCLEGFGMLVGDRPGSREKSVDERMAAGLTEVTAFGARANAWHPRGEILVTALRDACHGTKTGGDTDSCSSCETQEAFDEVTKARGKCCSVTACASDASCPGSRVCCKIPSGQICADPSRCGGGNRVE